MSEKQSKIYVIQLSDWIFVDPNFKKKYTQFIPISLRLLGSRQFDLLSKAGKMLTISLIEEAHRLGRSEVEVDEKFVRSQGEAAEKLLCDLEQNQILTSSLIKKERKKEIKKETFISTTSVVDNIHTSLKLKGEHTELDHRKETPLPPFDPIFEIERIYKEFYPRKDGNKSAAIKMLTQKSKPKKGDVDLRLLNNQDILDFEKTIKNYAQERKDEDPKFNLKFDNFVKRWRNIFEAIETKTNNKKEQTFKTSAFDGVAGVE